MLKLIKAAAVGAAQNEIIRQLIKLPRYTADQLLYQAREQANEYLRKLQVTSLDDKAVDDIKIALRRPVVDQESAEALGIDVNEAFEEFFERLNFEEPSPMYDNRWHLALMTRANYLMSLNAFNTINQRFNNSRAQWVQSQLAALQAEMEDDFAHEAEFIAATEDHLAYFDGEPGEA